MIDLSTGEKEMIAIALNMRRNYIETGDIALSAGDIKKIGGEFRGVKVEAKALSIKQMQLIIDMDNLMKKICNS